MTQKSETFEQKLDHTKELVQERHSIVTYLSWALLAGTAAFSLYTQNWDAFFLSLMVFALTLLPFLFQSFSKFRLPRGVSRSDRVFHGGHNFTWRSRKFL